MKLNLNRVILYACLLLLMACSKEKSIENALGTGGNQTGGGNFTARINNVAWVADSAEGASILGGLINISGISRDGREITMTLSGNATGQYLMDQTTLSFASFVDGNSANPSAFTTSQGSDSTIAGGVVNVTEIDTVNKTITGTFQFKVYRDQDSRQFIITEGVFNKIPYLTSLPPAPDTDTLFVKVGGIGWNPPSITTTLSFGKLIIAASEANASRTLVLGMPQDVIAGTYTLDYNAAIYFGEYNPDPGTFLVSDTTGTLTVLDINMTTRRIRGTFQFPAIDPTGGPNKAVLTEGYFSVNY